MASQCKRQQCTIDRRGFRQELDSWRHKLIHCVGFESILDGLFGPELVQDLKLFKDFEPTTVSDWSFDENCLFCCLRRDKVKEHLIGLSYEGLEDPPKPLQIRDQTTISRLEKQAEEFLHAVLNRKDVPNFADPHIPVVAREILQRMIKQFAAEYTSKTSPSQDSCSDSQPLSDQSLPTAPSISGAPPSTSPAPSLTGPVHSQNPVLSKLLMADQDAPLDLTIKKPLAVPSDQDGVLDLSIKKNRHSSTLPVRSPCLSPVSPMIKGESQDFHVTKAKDLQSTSTLEQFMAKLCPHHQRQIVDAIGFLQTEVKAFASSNTQQDSISTSGVQGIMCSTPKSSLVIPEKSFPVLTSTPKSEVQDMSHSIQGICATLKVPEKIVSLQTSAPALDLRSPSSESNQASVTPGPNPGEADNSRHVDHAPLKMKIMTSNAAAGKRLSCVLNSSLSSHSDTLEEKELNLNSSSRTETPSARLSSSVKRNNQSSSTQQARQRETLRHAKDSPTKLYSVHMTIPPDSPRTARKTIRTSSDHRDSAYRGIVDPDLGHCDIVFIDKPITECFKERRSSMVPRRNARKSTRGHIYCDEIWELKTVRTLAGRGNCPHPMPELTTLVTPKQILSKPEGVPPVDMPFAGACRETMIQQMSTEQSDEGVIPGAGDIVEVAASEVDIVVETSQTDQCQSKVQSVPLSPKRLPTESKKTDLNMPVEEEISADLGTTTECEHSFVQAPSDVVKDDEPEPTEESCESSEQIVETVVEPLENTVLREDECQLPSDKLLSTESILEQPSTLIPLNQVEEETEAGGSKEEKVQDEKPQEMQPETQTQDDNFEVTEKSQTTDSADELQVKKSENETSETVDSFLPLETDNGNDDDTGYDVSSKSLDALLKELPPWRRKKGTVITPPKWFKPTEAVVVGYVNGRPVSASDRSLRRRSGNSTSPSRTPVKSKYVANKNTVEQTVESTTGDTNQEECLSVTHLAAKLAETTPETSPVKEPTPIASSLSTKVPSRLKQISKQKKTQRDQDSLPVLTDELDDGAQSSESTWQLRSTSQKPDESQVSAPTSDPVLSDESPKPAATHSLLSTEQPPSLPPPPIPPVTAPVVSSSPPAATEQSEQNIAQEATEDLHIEEPQPAETTEEIQENNVENESQAKQKLKSVKAVVDDSESEKPQPSNEESSQLESQSPVKTETQPQTVPVKSKRVHRKEVEALLLDQPNVGFLKARHAGEDDSSSDQPTRMPLRSKVGMSPQSLTQTPVDDKKLTLRSQQRLASPPTSSVAVTGRPSEVASPIRKLPERITKAQVKSPPVPDVSGFPHSSATPVITPRSEPPKQANKFLQALTGEDNQQLIANLNMRYDKMQRGWVQMDKEGQPAIKYKNKADRQAAIWKSKRRTKKPKSLEHQKYSPVQMLFMKGFNLTNICRWFLESTETKSLVIVKKVNTRLPSETQLCFHSSSASGTSQGVFPSLQAERLKKHLKKFAIASPVKSNPKSQKLIAKALEQEPNAVKGKEKRELLCTTQTLNKAHSSTEAQAQTTESQKSSSKPRNPASARILRKYSNIREKMQVQQTNARLKKASKDLKANSLKRLAAAKSSAKSVLKAQKSALPLSKQTKAAKIEKKKTLAEKKPAKPPVQAVKAQSSVRASKEPIKKEVPKRSSLRLGSPKASEHTVETPKSKIDGRKQMEAEKVEVEKPTVNKMNASRIHTKESSQSTVTEVKGVESAVETPKQGPVPASPDQVLTRSQRKMEALVPQSGSKSHASKKTTTPIKTHNVSPKPVRKAEKPTLTRSGALRESMKRSHAASLPRSSNKAATKKTEHLLETPAKRTRTSLAK